MPRGGGGGGSNFWKYGYNCIVASDKMPRGGGGAICVHSKC